MPSNLRSPLFSPSRSRLARTARCSVFCCLLFLSNFATAAALGEATVRSALGQALDIDIPIAALSALEADSLIVRPAPASAYANAEIDYTPLLRSLRVFAEKRGEQMIVRVSSGLPVNDPFVRLLVEMGTSGSRTIREYTLLIDPPAINAPDKTAQIAPPAASESQQAPTAGTVAPTERPAAAPAIPPAEAIPPAQRIVRGGETLRMIGAALQPEGVRLEQVLVALQQANPDAFVGRNINRLRRGSVLRVPDAEAMRAVDPAQALRTIRAQAAEFNRYRQALAPRGETPAPVTTYPAPPAAGNRSSSAQVGVLPEARNPPAPPQDTLTLSSPGRNESASSQPGAADAADRIAEDKALADANSRIATLEKNISQLQQMLEVRDREMANAQQNAQHDAAQNAPQRAPAPAPAPKASAATRPAQPSSSAAGLTGPQDLLAAFDDPLARAGAAALVLLPLLAWAGLRWRRRRRPQAEVPPVEPVLAPTVIGGAGGRHVDTRHSEFHSNFVPSVSQIDANEVDAVAEADVYIAYGRDEQAEEILLDALRGHPQRDALRVKLLEIHAARKDRQKFGALAAELRVRTHGKGSEWERAAQLGRQLDPGNRLYEVAAPPAVAAATAAAPDGTPATGRSYAAPPAAPAASPVEDFSLRLEGLLDERRQDEGSPAPAKQEEAPPPAIDFRLEGMDLGTPPAAAPADEAALGTKLELAQACRDIGDREGARELLAEVAGSGHPVLARRAQSLLEQLA